MSHIYMAWVKVTIFVLFLIWLVISGVASLTLIPGHRFFTHNVTTCLDAEPTFMKAQKIMHIQYNIS